MINIPDRIWISPCKDDTLTYMTYVEVDTKDEPKQSFIKRMMSGIRWATRGRNPHDLKPSELMGLGKTFDNEPWDGFKIITSVSRCSTSNKLIRVEDPRGFVVEIPTENLVTLIHHSKIESGIVCEKCVWARDKGNHVLLPVNSEWYEQVRGKMTLKSEMVSLSKLNRGDVVKFNVESKEDYQYIGKCKLEYTVYLKQAKPITYGYSSRYIRYDRDAKDSVIEEFTIKDVGYRFLFKHINSGKVVLKQSGSCIILQSNVQIEIDVKSLDYSKSMSESTRRKVTDKLDRNWFMDRNGQYLDFNVINVELK